MTVDIRIGSPTYGQWYGMELSVENGEQLWIPEGFAHGFATLVPNSVISYKVTAKYCAACEDGLYWNDPEIGISWPVPLDNVVLSAKDKMQRRLADSPSSFMYK